MVRTVLVTLLFALAAPAGPAMGASRWWLDRTIQRELGLTPAQIASLDAAFVATLSERRSCRRELDALEQAVRRMIERANVDDATAAALISRQEVVRARRNTLRTLMLSRMYRILSIDQRAAVRRLVDHLTPR